MLDPISLILSAALVFVTLGIAVWSGAFFGRRSKMPLRERRGLSRLSQMVAVIAAVLIVGSLLSESPKLVLLTLLVLALYAGYKASFYISRNRTINQFLERGGTPY
jgi:amino acid transporter